MNNGKFIAFEGIDGSGKTTQLRLLSDRLSAAKIPCTIAKEPTDSPFGALVHNIMTGRISADSRAVAALFAADRIDHLTNDTDGICMLIKKGMTVLADRFYFSSYAYQSVDNDAGWIISLNAPCREIFPPDVNIFIDVPVNTALERLAAGRATRELYETKERLEKVRNNYFANFERFGETEKIEIIDGTLSPSAVSEKIWEIYQKL